MAGGGQFRMQDHRQTLQAVTAAIAESPRSGSSLILYALMNTINYPQAGCLFKLDKLQDLSPRQRQLAYALIELMATGANRGEAWRSAMRQVDELVRTAQSPK